MSEPRSDEAIRADLAYQAWQPPAVPYKAAHRLIADVGPLLDDRARLRQENERLREALDRAAEQEGTVVAEIDHYDTLIDAAETRAEAEAAEARVRAVEALCDRNEREVERVRQFTNPHATPARLWTKEIRAALAATVVPPHPTEPDALREAAQRLVTLLPDEWISGGGRVAVLDAKRALAAALALGRKRT